MKIFYCIILSFCFLVSHSQVSKPKLLQVENLVIDPWKEKISPITDMQEVVSFIYQESFRDEFISFVPAGYPLLGEVDVNSHFGARNHPVHHILKFHKGTDLKSKLGDKVVSTGDGRVVETGYDKGLGYFIKIKHSYGFESIYGHLSAISVKKGQFIKKEEFIGKVGATGTVTGPHLHYTIKKNGYFFDPFDFLFMKF